MCVLALQFRQPPEKISVEELKPYVTDHHSYCFLKNMFTSFVDMIKSILDKRFGMCSILLFFWNFGGNYTLHVYI